MKFLNKINLICGIILIGLIICGQATAAGLTVDDYYNQGVFYDNLSQYTEAIASYDKALEINPNYSEAWNNRGTALSGLGNYTDAVVSYDKALKIDSNYSKAWNNRGIALYNLGKYNDAVASYDKALEINPNFTKAQKNREVALKLTNQAPLTNQTQFIPTIQQSQQQTQITTSQMTSQQQTKKAPLIYAPLGAIALIVALSVWRRQK